MTFALIVIIETLIVLSPLAAVVLLLEVETRPRLGQKQDGMEWIPWIAVGTGYLLVAAFGTVFLL